VNLVQKENHCSKHVLHICVGTEAKVPLNKSTRKMADISELKKKKKKKILFVSRSILSCVEYNAV
jgi:hypothetical protein